MKKNLLIIIVMFLSISMFAQRHTRKQRKNINQYNNKVVSFTPNKKLLNKELWTRVSEVRFESDFLRLAVEWKNFEYQLLEMDKGKRVLAKSSKYSDIANSIINLTLRKSAFLPSSSMAQNIPSKNN